jgi:hypothetical protein
MIVNGDEEAATEEQRDVKPTSATEAPATQSTPTKKKTLSLRANTQKRTKIAFIGPSSAGKTSVLCSLKQAVDFFDYTNRLKLNKDEDALSFSLDESKEGDTLRHLLNSFRRGIIQREENTMQPTDQLNSFHFEISTRSGRNSLMCKSVDGKGGSLFVDSTKEYEASKASRQKEQILENAAESNVIIMCVDSSKVMEEFHQQHIQTIIDEIIAEQNEKAEKENKGPSRHLNVDSFIILLTKIDCLAERVYQEISEERAGLTTVTAASIVDFIDPIDQARECLGRLTIHSILTKLPKSSKLYVGMTSAWGFDSFGHPIAGLDGLFRFWVDPKQNFKPIDRVPTDEERPEFERRYIERRTFDEWKPYGIEDLIYFLLHGEQSGRFFEVTLDLLVDRGPRNTLMFP